MVGSLVVRMCPHRVHPYVHASIVICTLLTRNLRGLDSICLFMECRNTQMGMVEGMCKCVSTLWQRLHATTCSGTRYPCASPRPPVHSRIDCDLYSDSTQSTGVRFHLLAHKLQEHTDGCMVAGMCKYVFFECNPLSFFPSTTTTIKLP